MTPEETKAALLDVISNVIRSNTEDAESGLHAVLAAKMRDRVNPPPEIDPDDQIDDPDNEDPDNEDPDDDPQGE